MPFEIDEQDGYLFIRFYGTVNLADLQDFAEQIEPFEAGRAINRLTDLEQVEVFDIHFEELLAYTTRRKSAVTEPSKGGIIARRPLEFGLARMFQSLYQTSQIEIRIVATRAEALEWFTEQ